MYSDMMAEGHNYGTRRDSHCSTVVFFMWSILRLCNKSIWMNEFSFDLVVSRSSSSKNISLKAVLGAAANQRPVKTVRK
jgi:hypothetical protein